MWYKKIEAILIVQRSQGGEKPLKFCEWSPQQGRAAVVYHKNRSEPLRIHSVWMMAAHSLTCSSAISNICTRPLTVLPHSQIQVGGGRQAPPHNPQHHSQPFSSSSRWPVSNVTLSHSRVGEDSIQIGAPRASASWDWSRRGNLQTRSR